MKAGTRGGATNNMGFRAMLDKLSPYKFYATVLALLGFNPMRFYYPINGMPLPVTDIVKPGSKVAKGLMASA